MELMVSSVLIVMITLFLYNAIASMTRSNATLVKHDDSDENRSKLFELLYRDLTQSISIETLETKDRHYHLVNLQTANSLHEIDMPYVTYFAHTDHDRLIRLEAAQKISLPVSYEMRNAVHADEIAQNITDFNIYLGKIDDNQTIESNESKGSVQNTPETILLFLKEADSQKPLILELAI